MKYNNKGENVIMNEIINRIKNATAGITLVGLAVTVNKKIDKLEQKEFTTK